MPDNPTTITPSGASDAPYDPTMMLAARGVSDEPIPGDAMLPATHQAEPVQQAPPSSIDPGAGYTPYQEPQHEAWYRRILSQAASTMAGDESWKVTKTQDGQVVMEPVKSTEGQKWGRIAATLLGGLAQGLPQSFGPAGAAKAASAGIQTGLNAPKQWRQDADDQATMEQQRVMRNAQNAAIHQNLYRGMLVNQQLEGSIAENDAKLLGDYNESILGTPNAKDFGTVKGYDDLQRVYRTNPDFFKTHTNLQLKVTPIRGADGKFQLHAVATDPGWGAQRVGKGAYRLFVDTNAETGEPSLRKEGISEGSDKNDHLAMANQSSVEQFVRLHNAYLDTQTRKQAAETREADAKQRADDREQARIDRKENQEANRDLRREIATANRPSPDDYANEIPAILRGDTKAPPPGSRSPVAMAKRAAVFDADPTYSDSRYDTVQNFRTKGDAENIKSISTAMAHADRAASNSAKLGFNISPEHWPTGAAAAYRQDAQFVVDEIGKAVKGGVLTQHEGERRIADLYSPLRSVRDGALKESLVLLGGRVHAVGQKYKAGAGRPMSMDEFFDPDTQARLARIEGMQPQGGQPNNPPPPTQNPGVPASIAGDPTWTTDGKGNFKHYNGKEWVTATPPAR